MEPGALERWIASRQAAAERERREARRQSSSSIRQALDLIRLGGLLQGWPIPEDPVSRREDLQAYLTWNRLRAGLKR